MRNSTLIFILFFILGCSNDDAPDVQTGLVQNQEITISGITRDYHLFIPDDFTNAPLVLLLHGNGSSHDELIGLKNVKAPYKVWLDVAQRENLILAIPNGTLGSNGKRGWNDCRTDADTNPNTDDVQFTSSLINHIVSTYNANAQRVFVLGTSNGGHFSLRLAQEIPNKLKAFGAILASNAVNSQCNTSNTPISALIINGTDDPLLPYHGGAMAANRGEVISTDSLVNYWIRRNGTETSPQIFNFPDLNTNDNCTVEKHLYKNTTNNTEVVLYKVNDGGHTEPSIVERYSNLALLILGNQNGDIEMANEVWNFFKDK